MVDISTQPSVSREAQDELILWTACCSNKDRPSAECVDKTQGLLDSFAAKTDRGALVRNMRQRLAAIFRNRSGDIEYLTAMFVIDDAIMALGCVDTAIEAFFSGNNTVSVDWYLDEYVRRYGENAEFLYSKLNWLTSYVNYEANTAEVERILGVLTVVQG